MICDISLFRRLKLSKLDVLNLSTNIINMETVTSLEREKKFHSYRRRSKQSPFSLEAIMQSKSVKYGGLLNWCLFRESVHIPSYRNEQ